jgi:deoxyribodipyrimidine photo-lyase
MARQQVLRYLLRRDLRVADNPILHEISKLHLQSHTPFTYLLPIYVFSTQQIEVSGFLSSENQRSPYPEARSQVGGFWRCGHHRAKFLAESVWDVKKELERVGSGLVIRVGMLGDVVQQTIDAFRETDHQTEVTGLWMTDEEGVEEKREMRQVRRIVEGEGKDFKLWQDEKYFVDEYGHFPVDEHL